VAALRNALQQLSPQMSLAGQKAIKYFRLDSLCAARDACGEGPKPRLKLKCFQFELVYIQFPSSGPDPARGQDSALCQRSSRSGNFIRYVNLWPVL
jgi:hypothetical protein